VVVRIRNRKSIQKALSYNERKVSKGVAELLLASGFACDVNQLGFTGKLRRFELLNERNVWIKANTLHISLNFPPEEVLSNEKMQMIALDYMNRIGFAGQPFLVYRHMDANHPHLHIVTTTIQEDGKPIRLHNIAKKQSEPARKAIEVNLGLIPAESRKRKQAYVPSAIDLLPAKYGKEETKQVITNIVGEVLRTYRFTSLTEFNIILGQMNIVADGGREGSRMYQMGGMVYSILDEDGFRIGQSIKASDVDGEPTLKTLEQKFAVNAVKKAVSKIYVSNAVGAALTRSRGPMQLVESLKKRNIRLHFDQDRLGKIHAVYFVDHCNRATYTQEELGISLPAVLDKLRTSPPSVQSLPGNRDIQIHRNDDTDGHDRSILLFGTQSTYGLIHALLRPEHGSPGSSGEIPKKKKKKKRRSL
jgi:hypothetical protein